MIDPLTYLIIGLCVDLTLLLICPRERWSTAPAIVVWGLITIVIIWPIVVVGALLMMIRGERP